MKIRRNAYKTLHSRSVIKKTIIYTSELAFPAALASQANKSSDLQSEGSIWFPKSKQKQKQKRLQLNRKRHDIVHAHQVRLYHCNYF